jgi:DNA-binding GntR family transcriptional regulator
VTEIKEIKRKKEPRRPRRMAALQQRQLRVPRTGLHEQAAIRLRALIVHGEFQPGQPLLEADLSEALGLSRTPLREALKQLAAEGLVELRLNRTAVVAPLQRDELIELFEAVGGIERCAAELAATRMEPCDVERLEELQERIERLHDHGELRDYFETNQQIHTAIVDFARNAVLKATHEVLLARAERARFFALSLLGRWDESVQEHREILAALKAGDAGDAGRLLGNHVLRTGQIVAETLGGNEGAGGPDARVNTRDRATRKDGQ